VSPSRLQRWVAFGGIGSKPPRTVGTPGCYRRLPFRLPPIYMN